MQLLKYFSVFIFIFILFSISLYAEDKSEFIFNIGERSQYFSGVSDPYFCHKYFGEIGFMHKYFDVTAGGYRYSNYQLTDGYGNYSYINFNQGGGRLSLFIPDILNISGGAHYSYGESGLKRADYSSELSLYFDIIELWGSYNRKAEEYYCNSIFVNIKSYDYSGEAEFDINKYLSFNMGYEYYNTCFKSLEYDYIQQFITAGATVKASKYISFYGDGSAGRDSADYRIFGADAGIIIKIMSRIKLSISYFYTYYKPRTAKNISIISSNEDVSQKIPDAFGPDSSREDSQTGYQGGQEGSGGPQTDYQGRPVITEGGFVGIYSDSANINPYLKSSLIGKSYYSQVITAGATFMF